MHGLGMLGNIFEAVTGSSLKKSRDRASDFIAAMYELEPLGFTFEEYPIYVSQCEISGSILCSKYNLGVMPLIDIALRLDVTKDVYAQEKLRTKCFSLALPVDGRIHFHEGELRDEAGLDSLYDHVQVWNGHPLYSGANPMMTDEKAMHALRDWALVNGQENQSQILHIFSEYGVSKDTSIPDDLEGFRKAHAVRRNAREREYESNPFYVLNVR